MIPGMNEMITSQRTWMGNFLLGPCKKTGSMKERDITEGRAWIPVTNRFLEESGAVSVPSNDFRLMVDRENRRIQSETCVA